MYRPASWGPLLSRCSTSGFSPTGDASPASPSTQTQCPALAPLPHCLPSSWVQGPASAGVPGLLGPRGTKSQIPAPSLCSWLRRGGRAAGKKAIQVRRGGGSLAPLPALCRDSKTVDCAVKGLGRQHQVELRKSLRCVWSPLGLVGGA